MAERMAPSGFIPPGDSTIPVKETPLLFSAPMVRALLDGRKTQTRRLLKPQPVPNPNQPGKHWVRDRDVHAMIDVEDFLQGSDTWVPACFCPYGGPGDRLWVRETWAKTNVLGIDPYYVYRESDNTTDYGGPWRPSIFMPREASRITLEVTDVRVERLQAISEADAIAEGVKPDASGGISGDDDIMVPIIMSDHDMRHLDRPMMPAPVARFVLLWDSINGKQEGVTNWEANPWVWVVGFRRVTP